MDPYSPRPKDRGLLCHPYSAAEKNTDSIARAEGVAGKVPKEGVHHQRVTV